MSDYTATITTTTSIEKAYLAITERMSDWWTPMSAQFLKLGDKAKTNFGGQSYWVFEAKTLNTPQLIELTCCESNMIWEDLENPQEWLDTTLRFDFSEENGVTTLNFTHIGLTRDIACYSVCKEGWDHYFLGSLNKYLNSQHGQPNTY